MALMQTAFTTVTAEETEAEKAMPLVASISFQDLPKKAGTVVHCQPVRCSTCGAVLTDPSLVKEDKKLGLHYVCEFCSTVNVVTKDAIPQVGGDDVDFVLEEPEEKPTTKKKKRKATGVDTVAVIDVSGSMAGGKIEAVKQSLLETIADLKVNAAESGFSLITFNSKVTVYTAPTSVTSFEGDVLRNIDHLNTAFSTSVDPSGLEPIGEMADAWTELVSSLKASTMTAMGPALHTGMRLLTPHEGGKLILLTDGLANVGLGSLSGPSSTGKLFYETATKEAAKAGIVIDVVGMRGGSGDSDMAMDVLSELPQGTGGEIFFLSFEDVESAFQDFRSRSYLGRDVTVRLVTPAGLEVDRISGAGAISSVAHEARLGAVTEDREVFVRLKRKGKLAKKKVPLQAQIEYKDKEGRRHLRVAKVTVGTTTDEKAFARGYNTDISTVMAVQEAGTHLTQSRVDATLGRLKDLKKNLAGAAARGAGGGEEAVAENIAFVDKEIERLAKAEETAAPAGTMKGFRAVDGMQMQRMSVAKKREMRD